MVKTFDEELAGRVCVLLDCSGDNKPEENENAIRAAGSLIFAALDEGHHLQWGVLQEGKLKAVAPFSDGSEILEQLARLESGVEVAPAQLESLGSKISQRASLVFVAPKFTPTLANWLRNLANQGRRISLYLAEGAESESSMETHLYNERQILTEGRFSDPSRRLEPLAKA